MSRKAAPYARPKPRKPEYEEPPTLTTHPPPEQPERDQAPKAEPTRGGLEQQEKINLPETYAGQPRDTDPMRWLLRKIPATPEPLKVIRGRAAPVQQPKEKPVTQATPRTLADAKPVERPGEWESTYAKPTPDKVVGYRLAPAEKEDAEHKEA